MCLRLITYFRSRRASGFANIVTMVALPVALEIRPALPRTAVGKLSKKELRGS